MSGVWLASFVVLWLIVLVLAFLLAGALRQLGLLQLRLGDAALHAASSSSFSVPARSAQGSG